ncbi:MAG: gfo/Idh/MocA family oxidoreductase, partial [Planctomycetota bacterium]
MRLRLVVPALLATWIVFSLVAPGRAGEGSEPIRVGIIGTTTSHVKAFTNVINDPKAEGALAEVQVVAGFTGGIRDNPSS